MILRINQQRRMKIFVVMEKKCGKRRERMKGAIANG